MTIQGFSNTIMKRSNQKNKILLLFIVIGVFFSCSKEDFAWNLKKKPELGAFLLMTNNQAGFRVSAECISVGFDKNVEMGFCWAIDTIPDIEDNLIKVENRSSGVFSIEVPWSNISKYYVKAYIRNSLDTIYSNVLIVNWPGSAVLPIVQIDSLDQISFYSFNVNSSIQFTGGNQIIEKGVALFSSAISQTPMQTIFNSSANNNFNCSFNNLQDGVTYYVKAFATSIVGTDWSDPMQIQLPKKYFIGETGPSGGIIFYENPNVYDSWHYLESASVDLSAGTFSWSPNLVASNVTSVAIGDGLQNTLDICAFYGNNNYAALNTQNWVYSGCNDWILPSFNELKLMKEVLFDQGLGNFNNNYSYWSSSEDDNFSENAWTVKMSNGSINNFNTQLKNTLLKVRAIRRF